MRLLRYILQLGLLCFLQFSLFGQEDHTVYLIGDAGECTESGPSLVYLGEELAKDSNSTVVFLGDNIYTSGLRKRNGKFVKDDLKKLHSQLDILKGYKGAAYFVPGNHDWHRGAIKGPKTLKNQELYVDNHFHNERISGGFFPKDGLPGPHTYLLGDKLRIVLVDTQWWLHKTTLLHKINKNGKSKEEVLEEFFENLDSILQRAQGNNEFVIMAVHHPFYTNGTHGKKKQPFRFLFNYTPLHILGWVFINAPSRSLVQDTPQPKYQKMIRSFEAITDKYEDILFASGHDHILQVLNVKGKYHIISGAGSKHKEKLTKKEVEGTLCAYDKGTGFAKLNFINGQLDYIEIIDGETKEVICRY